jgi:ubiquinone/menaquinone biosynthesis C-methylase UbiE
MIKHGDFTELAKYYKYRPSYDGLAIEILLKVMGYYNKEENFLVVDVGAGTGIFAKILAKRGIKVIAVEPNDAMRQQAMRDTEDYPDIKWVKGFAESTGLLSEIADWVVMASSFHWTDHEKALKEFARILKPGGYFTAIWNPRDIEEDALQKEIDEEIRKMIPDLKRKSSGFQDTRKWEKILISTGDFKDCFFLETYFKESFTRERYLNVWKSVNDIRVQAGEKRFAEILRVIEEKIKNYDVIEVKYRTRAWTVKKK